MCIRDSGTSTLEWVTEAFERAVGYSIEEINALGGIFALVHPDDLPRLVNEDIRSILSGVPVRSQTRVMTKTGEILLLEGGGKLDAGGPIPRILVGMSDITERHQREEAVRLSRLRLDRILTLTPAVIFVIEGTDTWTPQFMSGNVKELFGYPECRLSNGPAFWHEIVHPEDRDYCMAHKAPILEDGRYHTEYRFRHGDGSWHWLDEQLIVVRNGGDLPVEVIGSWVDVTESRAMAEELRIADEQLKELLVKLAAAHEEERVHLSRELHDHLGQILTSASLFAKATSEDIPPERRDLHDRLRSLIDEALASTRSLVWTLRRSENSDSLETRLQQLADDAASSTSTELHLKFRAHDRSVSARVEAVVFRIVQEAITNVLRHARARHAWIVVTVTGTKVGALIKDDGIGFDPRAIATRMNRAGLLGMEERARTLDGTLKIDSHPGRGTIVRLDLSGDNQT